MTQLNSSVLTDISAEVSGKMVMTSLETMGSFRSTILRILESNGILNPQNVKWYPLSLYVNALSKLSQRVGQSPIYMIGMRDVDKMSFPYGSNTIESVLKSLTSAYKMHHRGTECGQYILNQIDSISYSLTCNTPYPCAYNKGMIEGLIMRYKKPGEFISVHHDSTKPCRDRYGSSCTFIIRIKK